jgi:hypothetical protein
MSTLHRILGTGASLAHDERGRLIHPPSKHGMTEAVTLTSGYVSFYDDAGSECVYNIDQARSIIDNLKAILEAYDEQ